jgi:hypothetical protein
MIGNPMIHAYPPDLIAPGGPARIDNLLNAIGACEPGEPQAANVLRAKAQPAAAANPGAAIALTSTLERVGARIALARTVQVGDPWIRGLCLQSLRVPATSSTNQHPPLGEVTSTTPFLPKTR